MGKPCELTKEAENDLREIARYTRKKWGIKALNAYRAGLNKAFLDLASKEAVGKYFSNAFPRLQVTKYKYHYIFYVIRTRSKPVIIGVIHEKRNLVSHLRERLS